MLAVTVNPQGSEQNCVVSQCVLTSLVIKVSRISTSLISALSPFLYCVG